MCRLIIESGLTKQKNIQCSTVEIPQTDPVTLPRKKELAKIVLKDFVEADKSRG